MNSNVVNGLIVSLFALTALIYVQFAPLTGDMVGALDYTTRHTSPYIEDRPEFQRARNTLQTDQAVLLSNAAAFWEGIKEGEIRMWESDVGTGAPLGGVVYTRVWFPFYWVGAVAPVSTISSFTAWFFLWSAQAGAWFLARRLGIGQVGAVLAGLAYGFSGPITAFVLRINEAALAPWVLAGIHGTISPRTAKPFRAASLLAIAVAVMWLGGFPAASVFTIYAAAAVTIIYAVIEWWPNMKRGFGRLSLAGFGVIGGTMLVSPLLLPTLQYLNATGALARSYPTNHAAGLALFGSSVSGRILGTFPSGDWWWPDLGYSNTYEASATIGMVVLALLAVGSLATRRCQPERTAVRLVGRIYLPLGVVVFAGTFLGGPVLAALHFLPFLETNSFGRSRFLLALPVALAAGLVLDGLTRRNRESARTLDAPFRILAAATVIVAIWSAALIVSRSMDVGVLDRALRGLVVPAICLLVGAVALALLIWFRPAPIGRVAALMVLFGALTVELQWGAWGFTQIVPAHEGFYPEHPSFEVMKPEVSTGAYRFAGTSLMVIRPNSSAFLDMADLRIGGPSYERYRDLMLAMDPKVFDITRLGTWFTEELDPSSAGLDRSAVRFLVAPGATGVLEAEPAEKVDLRQDGSLELPAGDTPVRGLRFNFDGTCRQGFLTVMKDGAVVGRRPLWQTDAPVWGIEGENFDVAVEDIPGPAEVTVNVEGCDIGLPPSLTLLRASSGTTLHSLWAEDAVIYERENARPRVELATRVRGIPDEGSRLEYLTTSDDLDTVILDDSTPTTEMGGGTVEIVEDGGDHLTLRVDSDGAGILVVRDANAPGWRAAVNGDPTDIIHAEHAYRAVPVPDGVSTVEMTYLPTTRVIGFWLAGIALVGILIGFTRHWRAAGNTAKAAGRHPEAPATATLPPESTRRTDSWMYRRPSVTRRSSDRLA